MSESPRPLRRWRFSLRTLLEAVFALGVILAIARGYFRSTIKRGDMLEIRVTGTLFDQPIDGFFPVNEGGNVELGPSYGRVSVGDLSIEEATAAVDRHLRRVLRAPELSVQRVNVDLAFQQLQSENRRLRDELMRSRPSTPIVVDQQSIGGPRIPSPSSPGDATLLNDRPAK